MLATQTASGRGRSRRKGAYNGRFQMYPSSGRALLFAGNAMLLNHRNRRKMHAKKDDALDSYPGEVWAEVRVKRLPREQRVEHQRVPSSKTGARCLTRAGWSWGKHDKIWDATWASSDWSFRSRAALAGCASTTNNPRTHTPPQFPWIQPPPHTRPHHSRVHGEPTRIQNTIPKSLATTHDTPMTKATTHVPFPT